MNQADASKISVEESLHAKHGPLALARSRLQIRTSRPTQEQVLALSIAFIALFLLFTPWLTCFPLFESDRKATFRFLLCHAGAG
jgi:hypothetical protein